MDGVCEMSGYGMCDEEYVLRVRGHVCQNFLSMRGFAQKFIY